MIILPKRVNFAEVLREGALSVPSFHFKHVFNLEKDRLTKLVETKIEELGFQDCFIVELKVTGKKIEVFLDSDEGVTYEKCGRLSRKIEEVLDEELWFGEQYTLDVSSCGIDRPLVFNRQYVKNIGRDIELRLKEDKVLTGNLKSVNEDDIVIECLVPSSNPKNKAKEKKEFIVLFSDIIESKIVISF